MPSFFPSRMGADKTLPPGAAACNSLLDRGYGKPVAPVELGSVGEFDHLSDDELYALFREESKIILRASRR
jgi:hypothetical protein